MSGFVDLHLHIVPGVDDGVRDLAESLAVIRGLAGLGYRKLVTTPHIREGMFDNEPERLTAAFEQLKKDLAELGNDGPELGVSAEHHCDGNLLSRAERGALLPYPGRHALLIEFAYDMIPVGVEHLTYRLALKRLQPVVAHPERCAGLFRRTDPIDKLIDQQVLFQLDLMSLVGKYGKSALRAAERMLDEGVYAIAASDTHGVDDLPRVGRAIEQLFKLVGDEEAFVLLRDNPISLLEGTAIR